MRLVGVEPPGPDGLRVESELNVCVTLRKETPLVQTIERAPLFTEPASDPFAWPPRVDLFGIPVTPTTREDAATAILEAAGRRVAGVVSCHAVHAIVTTSRDASLRKMVGAFDMITPDGQPVRWALNLLHGTKLRHRASGPELMLDLCRRAPQKDVSIYLYGGSPEVAEKLQSRLRAQYPQLKIAGCESPPFRPLTEEEDREVVERINSSGAGLVFIGLGCPKQDVFAFEHRDRISAVQVCVGAAFDFHAGTKKTAPVWMQKRGLEWLFRLLQEPGRLWKRYLVTNTLFVWMLFVTWLAQRRARRSSWIAVPFRPFR
jgi:exopolysaccharide biosynthesis WecB/TagA/CpsF family protein